MQQTQVLVPLDRAFLVQRQDRLIAHWKAFSMNPWVIFWLHRSPRSQMLTHSWSGLRRLLLGSIANKVARGATLPVLLYRPKAAPEKA